MELAAEVEKSVYLVGDGLDSFALKELKQLRAIESDGPDCDIIVLADFVTGAGGAIGEKAVAVPVAPVVARLSGRLRFSPLSTTIL